MTKSNDSPDPTSLTPRILRLDPSPSKVFSFLEWNPDAPEVRDKATSRLIQPAGPALHVRYRTTGAEWFAWPVTEQEARTVMFPDARYDFSIGRAYSQIILPHKSKRMVKSGERRATKEQRVEQEQRAGRRWLA